MNLIESIDRLLGGDLAEARKEKFEYDELFDTKGAKQANDQTRRKGTHVKVTNAELGQFGSVLTKIAQMKLEQKKLKKAYDLLEKENNDKILELSDGLFDAVDLNHTQVLETESLIVTIDKMSVRKTKKFDTELFLQKLEESGLLEDIIAQTKLLLESCTTYTQVIPKRGIDVDLKEGVVSWTIAKLKSAVKIVLSKFKKSSDKINDSLEELKSFVEGN
jgi:hypothetical protein